jgi:hypothetical protein
MTVTGGNGNHVAAVTSALGDVYVDCGSTHLCHYYHYNLRTP